MIVSFVYCIKCRQSVAGLQVVSTGMRIALDASAMMLLRRVVLKHDCSDGHWQILPDTCERSKTCVAIVSDASGPVATAESERRQLQLGARPAELPANCTQQETPKATIWPHDDMQYRISNS
jgi:hypothetical protein